jgi:hypothetical protein
MRMLKKIAPHLSLVMSVMMLTFFGYVRYHLADLQPGHNHHLDLPDRGKPPPGQIGSSDLYRAVHFIVDSIEF